MSITFSASRIETREWDGETVEVHAPVAEIDELSFNLSNANAYELLRFLGLEPDYAGTLPAAQVEGACLIALALTDGDPARPVTRERGAQGAQVVSAARAAGYLTERTRWLAELAGAARQGGHSISWA